MAAPLGKVSQDPSGAQGQQGKSLASHGPSHNIQAEQTQRQWSGPTKSPDDKAIITVMRLRQGQGQVSPWVEIQIKGLPDQTGQSCDWAEDQHSSSIAQMGMKPQNWA